MTELLKALRDHSLTAEERLKVACFVWRKSDLRVGSKHSVLVKWVCEELCTAYNKKTRVPPPVSVCGKLWEFLSVMLQASQCQPQDESQPSISKFLIQSMNEVFSETSSSSSEISSPEAISSESSSSEISSPEAISSETSSSEESDMLRCAGSALKSLRCIMALMPLPPVLYKFEVMAALVHSVMVLALSKRMDGCSTPGELFAVLRLLLKHYVYLQGTQGNQKKVFITTCDLLLEPVLMLRKLLLPSDLPSQVPEFWTEILGKLDCILASLFNRDHLPEFTSAVAASEQGKEQRGEKRSATSYIRLLFQSLERLLEPSNPAMHQAVIDNFPALLEAFLLQNKKEGKVQKTVEFQFIFKLFQLLGYTVQKGNVEEEIVPMSDGDTSAELQSIPAQEWCSLIQEIGAPRDAAAGGTAVEEDSAILKGSGCLDTLITVAKCLVLMLEHGTYQEAEDKIAGGKQFSQLQLLSAVMLRKCSTDNLDGVFSCLSTLLKLSHRILDPHMAGIWFIMFALRHQDTMKMEVSSFAQDCIRVYSKLRQLPLLLAKQMEALEMLASAALLLPTSPAYSPAVEYLLAKQLRELPPGQCVDILESMCQYFEEKCLPKLQTHCGVEVPHGVEVPQRKKKIKKGGVMVSEYATGTTGGVLGCLVAAVQKFADMFGIVLSHIPLEMFTGRFGEKAVGLLQRLQSGVCLPFLEACPSFPSDFHPSLCCASLHLVSKCCQLQACLRVVFPNLLQPGWMLDQLCQLSSGRMVPRSWRDLSRVLLSPQCNYLLRELVMLKLRFGTDDGEGTMEADRATYADLTDFVFETPAALLTDASWSGQLLDINEMNSCTATWSLVLSQLPCLYQLCSDAHLRQVAKFILKAMLLSVKWEGDGSQEGTTAVRAAISVLESESFVCMRRLQELLVDSCFHHAATSIPKWPRTAFCLSLAVRYCKQQKAGRRLGTRLHQTTILNSDVYSFCSEVKKALANCTEEEPDSCPQMCSANLSNILHHGLEVLGTDDTTSLHKRSKSISKWLNHLPAYLKLMRLLPMSAMQSSVLNRSLVAVTVWQISIAQVLGASKASQMTEEVTDQAVAIMTDLQYLMAWILHSLATQQRNQRGGGAKKKKLDVQASLPTELLLQWLYKEQMQCLETKDTKLLASSLVAVEMAFGMKVWQGEFPSEFTKVVVCEVAHIVQSATSCSSSFYTVECLKAITDLTCKAFSPQHLSLTNVGEEKVYQELGPSHKYSKELQVALQQLFERLTCILEQIVQTGSSSGPCWYSGIAHAIVAIIHCRNDLVSPRCLEIASLLCSAGPPSLSASTDRLMFCQQLEMLFGMVDTLSLPAAISQSSVVKDTAEVELPSELQILTSWRRLQEFLGCIFERLGCTDCSSILNSVNNPSKRRPTVSTEKLQEDLNFEVCRKVFHVMSQLLTAASREDTTPIFELIIQLDSSSVVSACVFCCCWHVVLDSKLSQESRRELRKWLTRALLKCEVIASLHQSSATHAVTMTIQLATRLVAIPQQVGLDRRSVVISLHLCSFLETSTAADSRTPLPLEDVGMRILSRVAGHFAGAGSYEPAANSCFKIQLVESVAQLLIAVIRNHSTIAVSCAGPVISAVNKLLRVVVEQGQVIEEQAPTVKCDLPMVIRCASFVARAMETVSNHKAFARFVPYPIGEFVVTAQKQPVHTDIKKALLPGVFSLLKLCTDHDLAFVKASLDSAARDSLQALIAEYQKFYKFSGRV